MPLLRRCAATSSILSRWVSSTVTVTPAMGWMLRLRLPATGAPEPVRSRRQPTAAEAVAPAG
jgi:hypothetical protein